MDVKAIVERCGTEREKLLDVLFECQENSEQSYLSEEVIFEVSKYMGIPESQVAGVASFYSLLSTSPRGKYIIQVCNDVPCYIKGSFNLIGELENMLGIKMSQTTKDGVFTLEFTSCLGCCDMAPAMQIGDEVFGNLNKDKMRTIINNLRRN